MLKNLIMISWTVIRLEKQILNLLVNMNERQQRMEDKLESIDDSQQKRDDRLGSIDDRQQKMDDRLGSMDERQQKMEDKLGLVYETVKRIEISQTEDVMGLLKLQKKRVDFEVEYINNKLTEMDKRLFNLEKSVEN